LSGEAHFDAAFEFGWIDRMGELHIEPHPSSIDGAFLTGAAYARSHARR